MDNRRYREFHNEFQNNRRAITAQGNETKRLRAENNRIKNNIQKYKDITDRRADLDNALIQYKRFNEDLKVLDDRIKDLEDKTEILKNAYNQFVRDNGTQINKYDQLVENYGILIDERDQLVRDNERLTIKCNHYMQRDIDSQNDYLSLKNTHNQLVKTNKMLFKENNDLKHKNAKLEADKASISSAFDNLHNSNIDSMHEIEDLKGALVGHKREIEKLKLAHQNTANLCKEFEVKNDELESENIKLKEDVENFKQYYEAMQFHYKMLFNDYSELEEECNRLKTCKDKGKFSDLMDNFNNNII